MTLYEELKEKNLNPIKLPLDLAYSVPYIVEIDREIGTEIITYKAVRVERN